MFGFHDRKDQGYLGNLRDRGHELFYHNDPSGNVTDLTDHLGSEVLKYRYDAFGGVFTQLWTPYNQVGLTGKSYDIKASLMDYSARWYSTSAGRFTTQDTWPGLQSAPQTQNRYAYALNNPINITDPSGHAPCYEDDDGSVHCGYSPDPANWGTIDNGSGGGGSDNGGGGYDNGGGGGYDNGGGSYDNGGGDNGGGVTPEPPWWMNLDTRMQNLYAAAGQMYDEIHNMSSNDIEDLLLGMSSSYADNATFGFVNKFNVDESLSRSYWYYRGRVIGDTASMYASAGLTDIGETGEGIGLGEATFTGSTVVGAPAAAPGLLLAGAGAVATVYGSAVAGHSAVSMSKDDQLLYSKSKGNGVDTLKPGQLAGQSIPARGKGRNFNKDERDKINDIGKDTGCHSCGSKDPGTKSGNFIPDHQPPNATVPDGAKQELYPHCKSCSSKQGGTISSLIRKGLLP